MTAKSCGDFNDRKGQETPVRDLISLKRDGGSLTQEHIHDFITQVIDKRAQESQIGAMLMAMYIRGLSIQETMALTRCMLQHGDKMEWDPDLEPVLVDKHSTGGVGDKVSLVLAPALAACGLKVPMLSGRGLDFTGGTLDKLESIPGFRTKLSMEEMKNALRDAGCFIAGPNGKVAPADGVLYGIRDVTSTVQCDGLVTGSILSKKLAGGAKALVIDVKVGRAAFYKTEEDALRIATQLVRVANDLDLPTRAVLTRMNSPIGRTVGNALEVAETLEALHGEGPEDLVDLVAVMGGHLLELKKKVPDAAEGEASIRKSLRNGSALRHFQSMLRCQGVSEPVAASLCSPGGSSFLPKVPETQITALRAPSDGVVTDIDAMLVAKACLALGAGRQRSDDVLDLRVGVEIVTPVGRRVRKGDQAFLVHHSESELASGVTTMLENALVIGSDSQVSSSQNLVISVVS